MSTKTYSIPRTTTAAWRAALCTVLSVATVLALTGDASAHLRTHRDADDISAPFDLRAVSLDRNDGELTAIMRTYNRIRGRHFLTDDAFFVRFDMRGGDATDLTLRMDYYEGYFPYCTLYDRDGFVRYGTGGVKGRRSFTCSLPTSELEATRHIRWRVVALSEGQRDRARNSGWHGHQAAAATFENDLSPVGEPADKPDSVPAEAGGDHLSGIGVSADLVRPTWCSAGNLPGLATHRTCLALLRTGFAWPPASPPAPVRSYRTVSPSPVPLVSPRTAPGGLLSVALSTRRRAWELPSVLPFGVRTFLDGWTPPRPPGRLPAFQPTHRAAASTGATLSVRDRTVHAMGSKTGSAPIAAAALVVTLLVPGAVLLPEPAASAPLPAWDGTAERVGPHLRERMKGVSWHKGCPVGLGELRLLRMSYFGFDREVHDGKLVVREQQARKVLRVFKRLYEARFPIRRMRLIEAYDGSDAQSMRANNTSAFNCRYVGGTTKWSEHAYGRAVDINPVQNPYVNGSTVQPAAGEAYLDRSDVRKGMIVRPGPVVRAFTAVEWRWGGDWQSPKDYQHFSRTGQ